jgi:hypothetical protein
VWQKSCGGAVSIGETLAQSRQRAGLSVAQVSEQTRIRETIIRGVENDNYSACGGDFYARGHIRAIAGAVGTDPGPLTREYDSVRRAPGAVSTVSLEELLATSAHSAQQRRPDPPAAWALGASAYAPARRRVKLPAMRAGRAGASGSGAPGELGRGAGPSAGGGAWFRDLPRPVRIAACGGCHAGGREPRSGGEPRRGWPSPLARHAEPGAEDQPFRRGTVHSTGRASAGAVPSPRRSG